MQHRRLILFPGLGVGGRLFARQRGLPAEIRCLSWPDPLDGETLADYALRLTSDIKPGGALYLGGVSFGAMVAVEAARRLRPREIFMIGGCRSFTQVSPMIRVASLIGAATPLALTPIVRHGAPLIFPLLGNFDRRERAFLARLFDRANYRLARWGARVVQGWKLPADLPCPVYFIHGSADRVVPLANLHPNAVVPGGGHFMNLTHAPQVNAIIAARLDCNNESPSR